jgi:hypothetical protein
MSASRSHLDPQHADLERPVHQLSNPLRELPSACEVREQHARGETLVQHLQGRQPNDIDGLDPEQKRLGRLAATFTGCAASLVRNLSAAIFNQPSRCFGFNELESTRPAGERRAGLFTRRDSGQVFLNRVAAADFALQNAFKVFSSRWAPHSAKEKVRWLHNPASATIWRPFARNCGTHLCHTDICCVRTCCALSGTLRAILAS